MRPLLFAVLISWCIALPGPCSGAVKVLREWNFAGAAGALGWTIGGSVDRLKVQDGALTVTAVGKSQAKLESPLFELTATPMQCVEIEMRTDADGAGLMYYSNTTEEPYRGFRPGLYAQFYARGDGRFHTYAIYPFWQKQGKLVHIRLDPPGSEIAIRAIRIIGADSGGVSKATSWDFRGASVGWRPFSSAVGLRETRAGLVVSGSRDLTVVSPMLSFSADDLLWATLRLSSKTSHTILLRWASDQSEGLCGVPIEVKGDGKVHSYSVNLGDADEWVGRIFALGITPSGTSEEAEVSVESLALGNAPTGPPELRITRFVVEDPFVRAGRQAKLVAEVTNVGGGEAEDVGVSILSTPIGSEMTRPLGPGETVRFEWGSDWIIQHAGTYTVTCRAACENAPLDERSVQFRVYPPADAKAVKGLKYVPEPKPADTNGYLVGSYYFPGWYSYDRWAVLDDFPERRPVLGYYREGDPEIADWHISWALTHGIGFFIFDWYWSDGARQLEHGLHDAFLKSRYQDRMKFCLLWANHNPPSKAPEQDLVNVTKYWIDNYFRRSNYLKVDGKNVMVIFSPGRLTEDLKSDGVKAAFARMRKMCEDAGVGGLYLVACTYPGDDTVKQLDYEGYDALSGYNYPPAGNRGQQYAPYEWMVDGYKDYWTRIASASRVPYIPVCEPGWDARPWHGVKSSVRTGKTPALWEKMLGNARAFVDEPKHRQDGEKKLVFLEAWNEFGEGDYIEPHAEFGFDYLEAVRKVFAPGSPRPQVIVPQDIGMGPYELEKPAPKTGWDFSRPEDRGWHVGNMEGLSYEGGVMSARARNHDPAFYAPGTSVDASKFTKIEIRMRLDKGDSAQVFFTRPRGQMSEEKSARFNVVPDNKFHVYTLDMSANAHWRGIIGRLRLDPCSVAGAKVEVGYVKLR